MAKARSEAPREPGAQAGDIQSLAERLFVAKWPHLHGLNIGNAETLATQCFEAAETFLHVQETRTEPAEQPAT